MRCQWATRAARSVGIKGTRNKHHTDGTSLGECIPPATDAIFTFVRQKAEMFGAMMQQKPLTQTGEFCELSPMMNP